MRDLFEAPRSPTGQGNARFLADLAMGVTDADMRRRFKDGQYADLHRPSVEGWRRLAGRTTSQRSDKQIEGE